MRKALPFLISAVVVFGVIFSSPQSARAVDCDGLGTVTTAYSGRELSSLKTEITLQIQYKWKSLTADKLECLDYGLILNVIPTDALINPIYVTKRVVWGKVGPNETKTASVKFTYNDFKNILAVLPAGAYEVDMNTQVLNDALIQDTIVESWNSITIDTTDAKKIYACVAPNNKYSCGQKPDCSDAVGCASGARCEILNDSRLCGQSVGTPTPSTSMPPSGTPGQSVNYQFDIPNPIKANDFIELITAISKWITAIAIPIAVIAIVYAGILWLTAGAYPKNVDNAKRVLKYALIGLAIIIIGRGFITLIESIINLGGDSGTPTTSQNGTPPPGSSATPPPGSGGAGSPGSLCQNSRDCASGLHCGSRNVCQRSAGNSQGEPCAVSLNCAAGLVCQGADLQNNRLGTCRQP